MVDRVSYREATPEGTKTLRAIHDYLADCSLPHALVELVYLRASQINGCAYCVDVHARELREAGVSDEKLMLVSVWREAGTTFDTRERAALAWTESLTAIARTGAPDADYAIIAKEFNDREIADLSIAISMMNAYNRLWVGLRMPPHWHL